MSRQFSLHLVTEPRRTPEALRAAIEEALDGGVDWVQLRDKSGSAAAMYQQAEHLQQALELMRRTRDKYPWHRVVSHTFPLERINEAFVEADQGRVTRAAIVP